MPAQKRRPGRHIPVSVRARVALKEYLAERGESRPEASLFMARSGKAVTAYVVWYTVKKYARAAGAESLSPRSLRNAVTAKLACDPEVRLVTAAAFLGQNRLEVLARHVRPEDL